MPRKLFDSDQDEDIRKRYLSGEPAQKIADSYGCYKQPILNSLKRTGTPRRTDWKRASGSQSHNWNGGVRWIKGYKHILLPEHHLARKDGYVPEHRMIMENKLGRKLLPLEVVNHIDEDTKNNDPDNLEVYPTNAEHMAHHASTSFKRNKKGQWKTLNRSS